MAPPYSDELFLVKVDDLTVAVPSTSMAPPYSEVFRVNVDPVTRPVSSNSIAPL